MKTIPQCTEVNPPPPIREFAVIPVGVFLGNFFLVVKKFGDPRTVRRGAFFFSGRGCLWGNFTKRPARGSSFFPPPKQYYIHVKL